MINIQRLKLFIKLIGKNLAVLLIILFFPALFYSFYKTLKPRFALLINQTLDQRAYYPTYADKQFSIQLLNELLYYPANYRSFIGWRSQKGNHKHTNVVGPYNARKSRGEALDNSAWFFGGSTMWGTGASDIETIPSHFNALTNMPVYNFGEMGWSSRQSLNQLIDAIADDHHPSMVIFYDGVNDILSQCRSEIKLLPAHIRQKEIQNRMQSLSIVIKNKIPEFILSPYISIFNKFAINQPEDNVVNSNQFDCNTNQEKRRSIARYLVNNWRTAYALSKSEDFKFYAILQPTLFTTKTNSEYFVSSEVNLNSQLKIQYDTVYPLIIEEIERYCISDVSFCSSIINGSNWLDGTNNIFIDFCHINSLGNKVIAQRLKSLLKI